MQIFAYLTVVCERVIRKTDTPGQLCWLAVAAAVKKAADSTENKCGHQADSKDIKIAANGQLMIQQVEQDDGDGQNDPRDIPALLNKMNEGYDVVYGWRYRRQDPFLKKAAAKIAALARRVIIGKEAICDAGCAMRVFRKDDIAGVRLSGGLHRFFAVIMARQGYRIGQVKVSHCRRKAGVSKYGILDRLVKGIADCFRISLMDTSALMAHKSKYRIKDVLKKSGNERI